MMQPDKFGVATLAENDETTLKSMGPYLVVIGLVGLAVLGFITSSPRNRDEAREGTKEKHKQNQSQFFEPFSVYVSVRHVRWDCEEEINPTLLFREQIHSIS